MPDALKNVYSSEFIKELAYSLRVFHPALDERKFYDFILDKEWDGLELKQRIRHISKAMYVHLNADFRKDIKILISMIPLLLEKGNKPDGFKWMLIPDFIECYGIDHYDISLKAMHRITKFVSCEFAIRPFLNHHPEKTLGQMRLWAKDKHQGVRRLASEGSRPRLPWAMGVHYLKNNPKSILSILDQLKDDPSETVRRSVANNLNDISKDHPELVIHWATQHYGKNENLNKLIRHASRTLLKQGNKKILSLFALSPPKKIMLEGLKIWNKEIKLGQQLEFEFILKNKDKSDQKLRLEYGIYYQKARGSLSLKIYKISEKEYAAGSIQVVKRRQSFKQITTRTFHAGLHLLCILVNGEEMARTEFQLTLRKRKNS